MRQITAIVTVVVSMAAAGSALAQSGLPTSQPNMLRVIVEEVKLGHEADHAKFEAGWPAAFEKAKSTNYYIALTSLTGRPEAWYITPYESNKAIGEEMKRNDDNAVLSAELARLSKGDADHISGLRSLVYRGRKDLSRGAFPDVAKQRFMEFSVFRVRSGHEGEFEAAAKAFGSAAGRAAPATAYRVYELVAGGLGPTYLIISSAPAYAEFDKMMSDGDATMKGANADEMKALQKFATDALLSADTQRFRVDPDQSYVPKEIRASDPFWTPKKPVVKKPIS